MSKKYEVIWEIFNKCANNQMRDVFMEEIATEDTDAYVRGKIKDRNLTWEKRTLEDGTIIYEIDATGMKERMSFTMLE